MTKRWVFMNQKPGEESIENDDKKFTEFAFDTHVQAYERAGVLSLSIMDKIKIGLTPDAEDLFSDNGLDQAGDIAIHQGLYYLANPAFAYSQAIEVVVHLKEINELVDNYYKANRAFFDEMARSNPQKWRDPTHNIIRTILTFPTFRF